jgi:hypothetical protein
MQLREREMFVTEASACRRNGASANGVQNSGVRSKNFGLRIADLGNRNSGTDVLTAPSEPRTPNPSSHRSLKCLFDL